MKHWKTQLIALLAVVNLGMLVCLANTTLPTAEAQSSRTITGYPTTQFLLTTGEYGTDKEVLYITDAASGGMVAFAWDANVKQLVRVGQSNLNSAFRLR
ncbi:MAG: hypothetical protein HN370_03425 [Phycisphaerales bacterium]|jgi:hypothetical protein|nr:hypothetical protein [Phycisphaerales bacterium]